MKPGRTQSVVFPSPTGEMVDAPYEQHELEMMREFKQAITSLPEGEERSKLLDELRFLHGLKAAFDGSFLTEEEHDKMWEKGLPDPGDVRVGRHHRHKPRETEVEAAILQMSRSGTARRRVLDEVYKSGAEGRTDEELSLELDMRLYTAAPRRNELLNDGWLMEAGHKRITSTGSSAIVWVMTEKGKREYERLTRGTNTSLIPEVAVKPEDPVEPDEPSSGKVTTTLL